MQKKNIILKIMYKGSEETLFYFNWVFKYFINFLSTEQNKGWEKLI